MKKICLFLIVVTIGFLLVGCSDNNTDNKVNKDDIEKELEKMTLDEKIGQMLIIYYTKGKMDNTLRNSLATVKPGGFILFADNFTNYEDSLELIKEIKNSSKIPMFIAIDQEGGNVQRLKKLSDREVTKIPYMYDVGSVDDVEYTKEIGRVIAEELRVFGVNMDFAPVIDVYENKDNTVIGKRSFGDRPEFVSKHGIALANSLSNNGVIPVYKHFPGHGNTSTDSHEDLPIVNKSKEELLNSDLIPFKDAIKDGAEIIMIGHLAVPSITGDNTPASLSKELITDFLKDELGYKGLVITDALNMGAITKNYSNDEKYVKAINAGVDLLLMPGSSKEALASIKKSVESGLISEDRIDDAVRKILALKHKRIYENYKEYLDETYLCNDDHREVISKTKKED